MEKVRIGNDIQVKYTVLRDGQPESFAGATNIVVTVKNEAYGKIVPSTFSILNNIVTISLDAADCVLCGKHRVTLSYNRGNDITIDALAFELVQFTSQTGGTEIVGVEIVTVNISGDIGIAIPDNNKIDLDGLNSNIDKLHFKPDTLVQLAEIGDVRYSPESKTLEVKVSDTVSIQLGQEMQTRVKNDAGVQINNGQLVYIDSAAGANPLAKIASTTDANIAQRTFGMATENIANNGFGAITTEGLVRDVNTAAFTEGDMLWLGTNGAVTNIEPVAPAPKISVGMVLRSNVANGVIYVKIRAISRNQKLSDVYAPTLTGGDILRWNSTTLRFETFNITTALAGKADLVGGKIPTSQLPSYVDDVLEYTNLAAFPSTGETGKIYVALDTNLTYRWSGTAYVEISKSLALGETSSTAYRGDRGKTSYDHSQATGNPHGTTAAQVSNVPAGTVAATTVQGAINELASDIVQVETDLNEILATVYGETPVPLEIRNDLTLFTARINEQGVVSVGAWKVSQPIFLEKGHTISITTANLSSYPRICITTQKSIQIGDTLSLLPIPTSIAYTAVDDVYVVIQGTVEGDGKYKSVTIKRPDVIGLVSDVDELKSKSNSMNIDVNAANLAINGISDEIKNVTNELSVGKINARINADGKIISHAWGLTRPYFLKEGDSIVVESSISAYDYPIIGLCDTDSINVGDYVELLGDIMSSKYVATQDTYIVIVGMTSAIVTAKGYNGLLKDLSNLETGANTINYVENISTTALIPNSPYICDYIDVVIKDNAISAAYSQSYDGPIISNVLFALKINSLTPGNIYKMSFVGKGGMTNAPYLRYGIFAYGYGPTSFYGYKSENYDFILADGRYELTFIHAMENGVYLCIYSALTSTRYLKTFISDLKIECVKDNSVNKPTRFGGKDIMAFNSCICLGDSLTVGSLNSTQEQGSTGGAAVPSETRSYPYKLAKMTGMDIDIVGTGGVSTIGWWDAYQSTPMGGYEMAIIQLGTNDIAPHGEGWTENTKIAFKNIIDKLRYENSNSTHDGNFIKIFVSTRINTTPYGGCDKNEIDLGLEAFVSELNNIGYDDVYFIDMKTYGNLYYDDYSCGHPNAVGYAKLAEDYFRYISYIMSKNKDKFRFIQFIGTDYKYIDSL